MWHTNGKYLLNVPDSNPRASVKEWIQQNWKQYQQTHGSNGQNKIVPNTSTCDTELPLRRKGVILLCVQVHTHERYNQYDNQSNAINMYIFPGSIHSYSLFWSQKAHGKSLQSADHIIAHLVPFSPKDIYLNS